MARKPTTRSDDEALQEALNIQHAEIEELKGKLDRLMTQRTQAQKENTYGRECVRTQIATLQENNMQLQDNISKGGKRVDSVCQTDNYVSENKDKDSTTSGVNSNNVDAGGLVDPVNSRTTTTSASTLSCIGDRAESVNSTQVNNDLVRGILNHFQSQKVNISLPTFDGLSCNPVEFIQNLEKYNLRKNIPEEVKLVIVEDALKGKAKLWHDARDVPFRNFRDFQMQIFGRVLLN